MSTGRKQKPLFRRLLQKFPRTKLVLLFSVVQAPVVVAMFICAVIVAFHIGYVWLGWNTWTFFRRLKVRMWYFKRTLRHNISANAGR